MPLSRVRAVIVGVAVFAACKSDSPVTQTGVVEVRVAPKSATLSSSQTQAFGASGRTAAGDSVAVSVTWSATGGTITSSGLYTAGQTAGVYRVIASATNDSLADTATVTVTTGGGGAPFGHVFVVTEENHNYSSAIGSGSMPYLDSLAQAYGLATQYYANTHPSIGNYLMLATGQIITNNDSYSTVVTVDNVVRRLLAAGKTWRSYAEDLPSVGYIGPDVGNYARRHNVVALLSDVANDSVQRKNLVPFTQFATDLGNGTLPDFSNIVPNLCNDAHDCSLGTADTWLRNHIAPILASATFQHDGLLIIMFDESESDNTNGGGRVAWVVVSPKAKRGYQATTLYQHQSTLRLTLEALGIAQLPGAAATAPAMSEFFTP
jgi:acid phosphatase